jgi:integrase
MQKTKSKTSEKTPNKNSSAKNKRYGIWQEETARHGRCWRFDIRVADANGKVKRKTGSGFATKAECELAVSSLRLAARESKFGLSRPEKSKIITVGEIVEEYMSFLMRKWKSKYGAEYAKRYENQGNIIRQWANLIGADKPVQEISKQDFILYSQSELERGLKASSIQRRLNSIRAALNYARENHRELEDLRIPRFTLGKIAKTGRTRILSETEIKVLSKALRRNSKWRDAYDFFRIALVSGGRFDEILVTVKRQNIKTAGIKWTDINKAEGTVRLFSCKVGGKERIIYCPPAVEILLERKKAKLGNNIHAFTCRDYKLREIFEEVSEECEIPYGQKTPGGWTVHDLRHTCLTNLLQAGVDLASVRDFAGHASIVETGRYVHTTINSKEKLAAAAGKMINLI